MTAEAVTAGTWQEVQAFYNLLNSYRQSHGAPAVALNTAVTDAAQKWANAQADFPQAVPVPEAALPTGKTYARLAATIYSATGPTPDQLHAKLVGDFGSANAQTMRDPKYGEVGIAVIRSGQNLYVYEVLVEKAAAEAYLTEYVHYSWSPAIYSVSYTPSGMVWKKLEYADWAAAGFPRPRIAGWIPGTRVFTFAPAPEIYATSADGVTHLLTFREWQDMDYRQPERSAGSFVKYPWSSSVYSVEFSSPAWRWKRLTYADYLQLGQPAVRIAGFIQGTTYYQHYRSSDVFALGEDGVLHKLTLAEYEAAGRPTPGPRRDAYYKTTWSPIIYYNANVNVEGSRPVTYSEWSQAQFPTPALENYVPFSFYWKPANSGNIYYRAPDGRDIHMSLNEWQQAGQPWPRTYSTTPATTER
jgi:Cysteine-rich secretory protein family